MQQGRQTGGVTDDSSHAVKFGLKGFCAFTPPLGAFGGVSREFENDIIQLACRSRKCDRQFAGLIVLARTQSRRLEGILPSLMVSTRRRSISACETMLAASVIESGEAMADRP